MLLSRVSMLSGKTTERDLPITEEELARWKRGESVQKVWPQLSESDREFILTGITDEEWDAAFGSDYEI